MTASVPTGEQYGYRRLGHHPRGTGGALLLAWSPRLYAGHRNLDLFIVYFLVVVAIPRCIQFVIQLSLKRVVTRRFAQRLSPRQLIDSFRFKLFAGLSFEIRPVLESANGRAERHKPQRATNGEPSDGRRHAAQ